MGKYNKFKEIGAESSTRVAIANELAEANRLKRLELKLKQKTHTLYGEVKSKLPTDEDLKDQA